MKLTLYRILEGEEEVIIRYREMTPQVESIAEAVRCSGRRIAAVWEGKTVYIRPEQIYYLENVDGVTYAYLSDKVVRIPSSLKSLEIQFAGRGFFRCAKSMILNIYKIQYLKSEPGNRIRAMMENGEQVIISRKYAKELRRILEEGGENKKQVKTVSERGSENKKQAEAVIERGRRE